AASRNFFPGRGDTIMAEVEHHELFDPTDERIYRPPYTGNHKEFSGLLPLLKQGVEEGRISENYALAILNAIDVIINLRYTGKEQLEEWDWYKELTKD